MARLPPAWASASRRRWATTDDFDAVPMGSQWWYSSTMLSPMTQTLSPAMASSCAWSSERSSGGAAALGAAGRAVLVASVLQPEVLAEQGRRREHLLAGEAHLPAGRMHRIDLLLQLAGRVFEGLELLALDEVGRPQQRDGLHGGGPAIDRHQIDAGETADGIGAQVLGKRGSIAALLHEAVRGDGHHQHIGEALRGLEVLDMAGVHQIETAVAVGDGQTAVAKQRAMSGEPVQIDDALGLLRGSALDQLGDDGRCVADG
jgi:hypothetical protein